MCKKLVIFGPWVGELSYELSWWIPSIREIRKKQYTNYDAVAIGFPGREILYKDFINKYIEYPAEILAYNKYPCSSGENVNGKAIIPLVHIEFMKKIEHEYKSIYDEIILHIINPDDYLLPRIYLNSPPGEYINYSTDENIDLNVNQILFNCNFEKNNTIVLVPKLRMRNGISDQENWNIENWDNLVELLITNLNINIVIFQMSNSIESAGTMVDVTTFNSYKKYQKKILLFNISIPDSISYQFSFLKATKCSLYGSTGAVILPIVLNTPFFTQQIKESFKRLTFDWQLKLTNNHKKNYIFAKYNGYEIYNSPVNEVFELFSNYYQKL